MKCQNCHTDISVTKEYSKLICKAEAARSFLENHPACGDHFFDLHMNMLYSAQGVCKRRYNASGKVLRLYYSPENYKRYKAKFDKEMKETGEEMSITSIDVTYREHFGEPWVFDHVEWWSEMSFVVFKGKDAKKRGSREDWESFHGVTANGRSFEEMVINTAKNFKKVFGNFSKDDFLTAREKQNHKNHMALLFKDSKIVGFSRAYSNKKYMHVSDAEINQRWVKWYTATPHGRKLFMELK